MKTAHPKFEGTKSQQTSKRTARRDQAADYCGKIATLAELLVASGQGKCLDARLVADTGWMILGEAEKLNELLTKLGTPHRKPKPPGFGIAK